MAKLGEAYVQIRADLKPFGKDLDKAVKDLTNRMSKQLNANFGKKLGTDLGSGFNTGFQSSTANFAKNLPNQLNVSGQKAGQRAGKGFQQGFQQQVGQRHWVTTTLASLTSALEDGFSSLPAPVKATVGAAIVGAIVPLGALISGALGAALIAGVSGIGTALAFQFDEVQERGKLFVNTLRFDMVQAADSFGSATINALDLADNRLDRLEPKIRNLFDNASEFLLPLTEGALRAVDQIVSGLDRGFEKAETEQLGDALISGLEGIGEALGNTFDILLSNPNLDVALADLLTTVEDLVTVGGEFLNWTVNAWNDLRPIAQAAGEAAESIYYLVSAIDKLVAAEPGAGEDFMQFLAPEVEVIGTTINRTNEDWRTFNRLVDVSVSATDEETKALEGLAKAFEQLQKDTRSNIDAQIDYQRSIDESDAIIEKFKGSLNLDKEGGRKVAESIEERIRLLGKEAETAVATGRMTSEAAKTYYDEEIARLRTLFKERGGNIKQFDELFGKYIELSQLPPLPDVTNPLTYGVDRAKRAFNKLEAAIRAAYSAAKAAPKGISGNIKVAGGTQLFADGGFITEPTMAMMGEGYRPELVLPLTQPSRSMDLLSQSPLANLMGSGTTVFAIFDGEPFQARIVRTARTVNRQSARTINQVPRSI